MEIKPEQREWFNQYFREFRDMAPEDMVQWGGYQAGLPTGMASSLESCLAFAKLVKRKDAVILNAGAGASSWVLRKMFKKVICTDPDERYLEVVKNICAKGGLDVSNFIVGIQNVPHCDYCYYDYGNIVRIPTLDSAVKLTKHKLYVDDTDDRECCKEYRDFIYDYAAKNDNLTIEDCIDAKDEHGRWGVILSKIATGENK
jgi:hypothetical protein